MTEPSKIRSSEIDASANDVNRQIVAHNTDKNCAALSPSIDEEDINEEEGRKNTICCSGNEGSTGYGSKDGIRAASERNNPVEDDIRSYVKTFRTVKDSRLLSFYCYFLIYYMSFYPYNSLCI